MNREEIETLLPRVFQHTLHSGSPLNALLEVMELMHAPTEKVLAQLEKFFNVYSAPDIFVPYLARWLDLDRFYPFYCAQPEVLQRSVDPISSGTGRLRELIAAAANLSQWRGTAKGLKLFLETATGISGFDITENIDDKSDKPRPFHIRITAPSEAESHIALIERIVEQEKPAYVSYELAFKSHIQGGTES